MHHGSLCQVRFFCNHIYCEFNQTMDFLVNQVRSLTALSSGLQIFPSNLDHWSKQMAWEAGLFIDPNTVYWGLSPPIIQKQVLPFWVFKKKQYSFLLQSHDSYLNEAHYQDCPVGHLSISQSLFFPQRSAQATQFSRSFSCPQTLI